MELPTRHNLNGSQKKLICQTQLVLALFLVVYFIRRFINNKNRQNIQEVYCVFLICLSLFVSACLLNLLSTFCVVVVVDQRDNNIVVFYRATWWTFEPKHKK